MKILIVDDDTDLTRMLTQYLAGEGFEASTASDGTQGVAMALSGQFGAVILDVMMPNVDGIEALRRIRRESDLPVIMLTARGEHIDRVAGLETGADDYVPKPYYPMELVARLRAVLRRSQATLHAANTRTLSMGQLELSPAQRRASWQQRDMELTVSEFNVLEILLRNRDVVVSKDEISLGALGRKREPYDRSVDVHVSNIRQKLASMEVRGVQIETARGVGYRMFAP